MAAAPALPAGAPSALRLSDPFLLRPSCYPAFEIAYWMDTAFLRDSLDPVLCMEYNEDGTYLACGTEHGRLIVWDTTTAGPALVVVCFI